MPLLKYKKEYSVYFARDVVLVNISVCETVVVVDVVIFIA
jgi:hypothetical protein